MKFWSLVFKEINEILKLNVEVHSRIVPSSIFDREQWDWTVKELITKPLVAARLMIAKNWKIKNDFQLNDWYKEVW